MNPALAVALGVAVVFVIILVSMSIRIIRPFEKGLIERLGKYQRLLEPGLNMIKRSVCSGPIGSSAISARPVLETTVAISGILASSLRSISEACFAEPSVPAVGKRTMFIAIAPSSSGGRNSVPILGSTENAPTIRAAATARVIHRPRRASVIEHAINGTAR